MSQDVINCPACARRTPAARGKCLYCDEALPVARIEAAPPQRNIDYSERAFNAILETAKSEADPRAEEALAAALKCEAEEAGAFVRINKRIPIARCQHRQEAELIAALVRTCWLNASVVADDDLQLANELMRARRVVVAGDEFQITHAGGEQTVALSEIRLMVVGALRNIRVDYTEGISGMRGQGGRVLDTAEFSGEETLLDVYSADLEKSFRIRADAFDYSGLVGRMSYRAEVNFQSAIRALSDAAESAALDEDFARVRPLLARAWPERSKVEARGVKRAGLAYRPVAQSSVISNNRDQFDRYSRLMYLSIAGR